jgi:hypothetical protein
MNAELIELAAATNVWNREYTLPKNISAIQILSSEHGEPARLGLITQLPQGAEVTVGGPGFSEGTIKVRCAGSWYFVFMDDLEMVKKPASAALAHMA